MCKFYLRADDLMKFYDLDSKSSAYRQKRAIKDALELSNTKRLTVKELCEYESIDIDEFKKFFM